MSGLSLLQKTEVRRRIDRVWSGALTPTEMRVLLFIFTITVEWGKASDRMKVEHIRDGFAYVTGTGLSDKTIRRALDHMVAMGVVFRKRTIYGAVMGVNLDWDATMHLRTPKKERAETGLMATPKEPKSLVHIGQNDRSISVILTDTITKGHTSKLHTYNPSPSAVASVGGALSGMALIRAEEDRVKGESRKRADAAKRSGKFDPTTASRVWFAAWKETYPEQPATAWTARDIGMVKTWFRYTDKTRASSMLDVLEWAVRSWRLIMTARFSWMTDSPPPAYPVLNFLLKFRDHFLDAWRDKERLRADSEAKPQERRIRKLIHRGLTPEEARAKAGEQDEVANLRAEVAKVKGERDRAYRRSEMEATARRLPPKNPKRFDDFKPKTMTLEEAGLTNDDFA